MSKFKLISPNTLIGSDKQIDWSLCFLCQKTKQESLKVPLNKPGMLFNFLLTTRLHLLKVPDLIRKAIGDEMT